MGEAGVWRWDLCLMSDESQLVRLSGRVKCFVRRTIPFHGVFGRLCGLLPLSSRLARVGVVGIEQRGLYEQYYEGEANTSITHLGYRNMA